MKHGAILLMECKTDDPYSDHAIAFLPYQRILVCRNNEFIKVTSDDVKNTREISDAMQSSFGFRQLKAVFFVAIITDQNGLPLGKTSHIVGC